MSSLGDLLLSKAGEQSPTSQSGGDAKIKQEPYDAAHKESDGRQHDHNKNNQSPPNSNDDSQQDQKVFPDRVEKRKIKDEDCKSNASSTDDYVRELLDPNDRPRNVWHVVEEPKVELAGNKNGRADLNEEEDSSQRKRSHDDMRSEEDLSQQHYKRDDSNTESPPRKRKVEQTDDNSAHSLELTHSPKTHHQNDEHEKTEHASDERKADEPDGGRERHHKSSSRHRRDERVDDDGRKLDEKERSSSRRSSSSRHNHKDRHSSRDDHHRRHDKDRHRDSHDRDRDRDRERDRGHRSSRRRRDYSDDDDEDLARRDRGDSRGRSRHHRHSRSRSISRRRSRSDSHSPLIKRNSRTVLVMQLSQRVTNRDLEEFFSDIGAVREVRLIMDSKTRRHKGIAYIEFEEASSATRALALNGKRFHGAPLQIQSALLDKERDEAPISSSRHHHHSHHHHSSSNHSSSSLLPHTNAPPTTSYPSSRALPPNSYRIYIGGLHMGITDEMLRTIVEPFGHILRIELIKDRNTGASRGYAFVLYANVADGQEAVAKLDGFELAGKCLRVSKSTEKSEFRSSEHHY